MKKIMEFLFGKKYPIFNKEGEIEHPRKNKFKEWKDSYTNNPEKNWRNHQGMTFNEEKSGDS